jgi:hypothetical protein
MGCRKMKRQRNFTRRIRRGEEKVNKEKRNKRRRRRRG